MESGGFARNRLGDANIIDARFVGIGSQMPFRRGQIQCYVQVMITFYRVKHRGPLPLA